MSGPRRMCANQGWLVPSALPLVDQAWQPDDTPAGCANLACGRCGRRVISFERALLGKRPADADWLRLYDVGGLVHLMEPSPAGFDFRLYICGCRAFACGVAREVAELAIDDDLPWYCAGHPQDIDAEP